MSAGRNVASAPQRRASSPLELEQPASGPIAGVVAGFIAFGISRGLSPEAIFARAGLTPADLADPDRYLPGASMLALWEMYLAELDEPALPLSIAQNLHAARFGIVGELMRAAADVRQALTQYVRYCRLSTPHLRLSLEETASHARVTQEHHPAVEGMGGPIEFMLALLFHEVSSNLGGRLALHEVTFKHAARGPVEPYTAFFGAPVRFSESRNSLVLRAEELNRPLPTRAPETIRYLEAHAARMLEALPPVEASIIQRVRDVIAREMAQSGIDQAHVARRLAMSTRTLQRRLGEAGTTFADLLDDMRRANALTLVRSRDTTITDAAFLLGYSDVPTFYRAFKRWTGTTPQAFRASA